MGGSHKAKAQDMVKTPRMSSTTVPYKTGHYGYGGNGAMISEITQLIKNMEKTLMMKMETLEKKLHKIANSRKIEEWEKKRCIIWKRVRVQTRNSIKRS